ncbi:MAG: S1 family peptidase [Beijerinckiaceae bacterium]
MLKLIVKARPNRQNTASVLAGAVILAVSSAGSALALGGSSVSDSASWLENKTVMVHGSRGNVCSGTVLSPTVIMTAAHCVSGSSQYKISYKEGGSSTFQEVRQIAIHPNYIKAVRGVRTDIALVRLRLSLPYRFSSVPLDDDAKNDDVGSRQVIGGFGLARGGDDKSLGTLRTADVVVLKADDKRFFRLGLENGELRVCTGDSGGPVFSASLVTLKLTGVIYAAEGMKNQCGGTAQAVRVAPQRKWIDSVRAGWGE